MLCLIGLVKMLIYCCMSRIQQYISITLLRFKIFRRMWPVLNSLTDMLNNKTFLKLYHYKLNIRECYVLCHHLFSPIAFSEYFNDKWSCMITLWSSINAATDIHNNINNLINLITQAQAWAQAHKRCTADLQLCGYEEHQMKQ